MSDESVVFDRAADFYDETRGFPPGEAEPVAAMMAAAAGLTPASRVLEVGIGTGRIALPLAPHVRAMYGIDLSRLMLARLLAKRNGSPVYVAEGDAARLPFSTGTFDAVVAVHIFHLIPGWRDVLAEVARVLRPGGVLVKGQNHNPHRGDDDLLWAAWNGAVREDRVDHVGVPRARIETFLPDAGWRRVGDTHSRTFTRTHSAREFLDRIGRRVWSSCWRIPDEAYARGMAAVRAAIATHQIDLDTPIESEASFSVDVFLPPEL